MTRGMAATDGVWTSMKTTGTGAGRGSGDASSARRQRHDEQAVRPLRLGERPQVVVALLDRLDVVDDEVELAVGRTASTPRSRSAACGRVRNETTTPMVSVRPRLSRRAAGLGVKPSSSITARIRSRVCGVDDVAAVERARAVATLTPAWRATSRMVTAFFATVLASSRSHETGYMRPVSTR